MRPEAFPVPCSLFPVPSYRSHLRSRLPRTGGTSLTAPHALTAVQWAPYVTRISPPAPRVHRPSSGNGILRRRRVLVELRSPVDTRQKPIRVGTPPVARCPHTARPVPSCSHTLCLSDNRAARLSHRPRSTASTSTSILRSYTCPAGELLLTRFAIRPPTRCCSNRCVLQRRTRFARDRAPLPPCAPASARCPARPANTRCRHTMFAHSAPGGIHDGSAVVPRCRPSTLLPILIDRDPAPPRPDDVRGIPLCFSSQIAMSDTLIVRQPVFDRSDSAVGYELRFRVSNE